MKKGLFYLKGQIAAFFTFVIIILLVMVIFTVNLGRIGFHRVGTSVAADSAALAGGTYMDYALNSLVAQSRQIYMDYIVGMATCVIPIWGTCCIAPICGPCTSLPLCSTLIAEMKAMKYAEMALFAANQFLSIQTAEQLTYKGFRQARASARQYAFQNAGIDDLTKFDKPAANAAGVSFSGDDPDKVVSSAYDAYFIYRDTWLKKGYTPDAWQKAESRFSLWLDLWGEKEREDEQASLEGEENDFNDFGEMSFAWPYPTKEGKNRVTVDVDGDDFSGVVTAPSVVVGIVIATEYVCVWVPVPGGAPVCVYGITVGVFRVYFVGPEMFIVGISGEKTPEIAVTVKREEPGQDMGFWQSRYPIVESRATAEVYGGEVGTWGDDDYDTRLISTR